MKILITGSAGFIGSNLVEKLCQNKKNKIFGIDNFSEYSGKKLKKIRLRFISKNKNFYFKKIDINDKKKLDSFLSKIKFDIIIHLAAEVGVRYSEVNPSAYIKTNINGFFNLLDSLRLSKPKKIIYASSSSVYGDSKKFPLKENQKLKPKNIYALSKINNEEIAEFFYNKYNVQIIGLRFFTVFGEMGRPDMFFFKLLNAAFNKKLFFLNNSGNHYRDFTYVKDVVLILEKLIFLKKNLKNNIYNVCVSRPVFLVKMLNIIKKFIPTINLKNAPVDHADVFKTHGDNKKIMKILGKLKVTNLDIAIQNTINWYKKNKIYKIK